MPSSWQGVNVDLNITIPENKLSIIIAAFTAETGIEPTPSALKKEIINSIKRVVRTYMIKEAAEDIINIELE
jgi:hypothetical protein